MLTTWIIGYHKKEMITKMDNLYSVLSTWYPEGDYTEAELWDAIAEVEGVSVSEIMDGDLADYL
jgi:hypothetical protein